MQRSDEAQRLFDNPAWEWMYNQQRQRIISELETLVFDGSDKADRKAIRLVMELQAALANRREGVSAIAAFDRETKKQR